MPGATVTSTIVEVWQENLEEEFAKMRETVLSYHYIAMVNCIKIISNSAYCGSAM